METTTPLKVLLVGQYGVGKSSFLIDILNRNFILMCCPLALT